MILRISRNKKKNGAVDRKKKIRRRSDLEGKLRILAFNLLQLRTMRNVKENGGPGEMAGPQKRQLRSDHHTTRA